MSAHDQIRAMLDQLMGTARNGEEEKMSIKFDDARVCKSFLMGCCPHEILASTRMDLGDCARIHNLALRADYEIAAKSKDYFYDLEALDQLYTFVAEADRKTEIARKRLAETQEELTADVQVKADKVHELGEKIGEALAKAEQLGAEGRVDDSMKVMAEIDVLRKEKAVAEADYRAHIPAATYQQQKLRVCDVCCAYLGIHDNDRRLADHFGGKLHLGFIKIRETLKEYQEIADERRKVRRESLRTLREEDRGPLQGAGGSSGFGGNFGGGGGYGGGGGFNQNRQRGGFRDFRGDQQQRRGRSRSPVREDKDRDRRLKEKDERKRRKSRSRSKSPRDKKKRSRSRSKDKKRSHKDKKSSRSKERRRSSRSRSKDKDRKSRHSSSKRDSPPPDPRKSSISEGESGEI